MPSRISDVSATRRNAPHRCEPAYILLINLCSKTHRLRARVSEMWRRTQAVWITKASKGVKQTIEILSVNTIFDTLCILPHYVMPNSWKDSRHTCIRATRSCVSTGVSYSRIFMYAHKWKSNCVGSGERGGHAIGPPRPIHLLPKVSFKWPRTTWSNNWSSTTGKQSVTYEYDLCCLSRSLLLVCLPTCSFVLHF